MLRCWRKQPETDIAFGYMEIYRKALLVALRESLLIGLVSVGLFLVILFVVKKFIRDRIFPKWVFWIYLAVGVAILGVGSVKDFNLLYDLNKDAYVVYYGEYRQRVEGYQDSYYATTLSENGNMKLLCHFTMASDGVHNGYVVYGEKSKIVVYLGAELPSAKTR